MRALFQWLELDKSLYRSRWRLFGHVCLAMIIANIGLVGYRVYLAVSPDMDMTAGSNYEIARVATVPLYLPENIDGKIRMARVESLYNTASENPDHETLEEAQHCLAQAIYFEARGEPVEGWEAVGQVVINRVRDKRYPGRICDVVFQGEYRRHRCQFSFACDGVSDRPYDKDSWQAVYKLSGKLLTRGVASQTVSPIVGTATHYHADYVVPHWSSSLTPIRKIGRHIFYREEPGGTAPTPRKRPDLSS